MKPEPIGNACLYFGASIEQADMGRSGEPELPAVAAAVMSEEVVYDLTWNLNNGGKMVQRAAFPQCGQVSQLVSGRKGRQSCLCQYNREACRTTQNLGSIPPNFSP